MEKSMLVAAANIIVVVLVFLRKSHHSKGNPIDIGPIRLGKQLESVEDVSGSVMELIDLDKEDNGVKWIFQVNFHALQFLYLMQKHHQLLLFISLKPTTLFF
jgi:hypothetical protein